MDIDNVKTESPIREFLAVLLAGFGNECALSFSHPSQIHPFPVSSPSQATMAMSPVQRLSYQSPTNPS